MSIVEINRNPSPRQLRQFGFVWMGFLTLFGFLAWWRFEAPIVAWSLWVGAVVVPALGWIVPAVMRVVFLALSYAAWPIGYVVSHIVLAVVYYLVLTPIGLIARSVGYDPMERRFEADSETYWVPREETTSRAARYFRQF